MDWLDCGIGRCDGCVDERRVLQPADEPVLVLCAECARRWTIARELEAREGKARPASVKPSYWRERRDKLKAKGLCIDCAIRPAMSGITRCKVCREQYLVGKGERKSA